MAELPKDEPLVRSAILFVCHKKGDRMTRFGKKESLKNGIFISSPLAPPIFLLRIQATTSRVV
jgi:hypothetical protein